MELRGKRVVVMGLGRFGGGIGVTRWLCAQGARVLVTDVAKEEDLAESLARLGEFRFERRFGGHDESDLDGCELLVVSPAVDKRKAAFFQTAVKRGIPWSSEMNLFLSQCSGRVVGITGSVGKSTTTAMTGEILEAASRAPGWQHGRVWLGGNIGKSLLDDLPKIVPRDLVVLELSSFQMEDADAIGFSPHIALLTNVKENHLDRHGTMESYAAAKGNIYRHQGENDWLIMPWASGEALMPRGWEKRERLLRYGIDPESRRIRIEHGGEKPVERSVKLAVPGLHNLQNAAAALAIAHVLNADQSACEAALAKFAGLVHRLEFVRELSGVKYYNDSKATTPDAAMTSLRAFDVPVVMMVGGSDKGSSFAELGQALAKRAKAVVCMGQTRDRILQELRAARGESPNPRAVTADDMRSAVEQAREMASAGDVVLLSPACASYDWFKNYEHRGDTFKSIVNGWSS